MAGARLAQQVGARAGLSVTVIGEEPHAAYNRVLLADVLAGHYPPEVIALPRPADNVTWRGGVRAVRVDRTEHRVVCDDGSFVPYDALVLATGSNPVLPPLRGLFAPGDDDLPEGVQAFRTLDDCLALDRAVDEGTRAVVIGGGLLGVSAARALALRGARVVLAQQGEHLMERHLDAGASALLREHLTELGVEVHTECRVRSLVADGAPRRARAVELADGYRLDAELVVLACGVRPRTGLARAAGLRVTRGIVVDDRLRTSDSRVFALGDCAEHGGVLYGLAGAAQEQADVLARVLAETFAESSSGAPQDPAPHGRNGQGGTAGADRQREEADTGACYPGTRALVRLTLGGSPRGTGDGAVAPFDLAAFGETTPEPGDDVVHLTDGTRGAYRKIVVRGDRLRGGILLGDLASVGALARTWEGDEELPAAPLLHLLTHDGGL